MSAGGPRRAWQRAPSLPRARPCPGSPRPARGPVAATAGPAGAARGLHWACSDGGQVAARASFRAARPRDLPGRPAPPDAAGMGGWDLRGVGRGAGCGDQGLAGRHPTPTRPGARRTCGRTSGRAGSPGSPAPRRASWGGAQARITWRGWGGARAGTAQGWAFRTRRRGRGRALQSG